MSLIYGRSPTRDEYERAFEPSYARLSAVESKPASKGRIKTSHFFRLNRRRMFLQAVIEEQSDGFAIKCR